MKNRVEMWRSCLEIQVKGLLSLPVKSSLNLQKTIGVIQVLNKRSSSGSFSEQDAVELQKIAMVIGDSFHRQRWNVLETVFEAWTGYLHAIYMGFRWGGVVLDSDHHSNHLLVGLKRALRKAKTPKCRPS